MYVGRPHRRLDISRPDRAIDAPQPRRADACAVPAGGRVRPTDGDLGSAFDRRARSIVENLPGQENAYEAAIRLKARGYHGCWVLALGTTDSANIAAGSSIGRAWRIDRMMSVIGADPVLWMNVKTTEAAGSWSNTAMVPWNLVLVEAAARYPNIIVYDWASVA